MKKILNVFLLALSIIVAPCVQADNNFVWLPSSGTSSWFTASNWDENSLPGGTNVVFVNTLGLCTVNSASSAVVDRLYITGSSLLPLAEVVVESGSTLTVSNYFVVGNNGSYGKCTVKGTLEVPLDNNNGTIIGGYNVAENSYGELVIDGGTVSVANTRFKIGGSGTGVVHIVNGGTFINTKATQIGYGDAAASDGLLVFDDGTWINGGGISIGNKSTFPARGILEMNGGLLTITNTSSAIQIGNGAGAEGTFYLNGGELKGALVERETMTIGISGGDGTFIQNGGTGTVIGVHIAPENGVGNATAIFNNGVFNTKPTNGSWPAFKIFDGGSLVMAGGTFSGTGSSSSGAIYNGGTLELRAGSLSLENTLSAFSNSTIRIIGPLCTLTTTYWRGGGGGSPENYRYANMELILTKDADHLAPAIRSTSGSPSALPRTLKAGLDGGACMLSTNAFAYVWAASYFESYLDPTAYGLDLWDSGKVVNYDGTADILQISLKAAALQGTASLPNASIPVADMAYGYIDVEGMDSGSLPELTVNLNLTEVDGTVQQILADLKAAGYTNSTLDGTTISMLIDPADLPPESGHFAWDFREFDGTTNATVSNVSFIFAAQGTIILLQ